MICCNLHKNYERKKFYYHRSVHQREYIFITKVKMQITE